MYATPVSHAENDIPDTVRSDPGGAPASSSKRLAHCALEARVAELTRETVRLRNLSTSDPRVGLANRRRFEAHLERCVASAHENGDALSVVVIHLDGLFRFGARHGRGEMEALLRRAAVNARDIIDESSLFAYLGEGTFALLLPRRTEKRARRTAVCVLTHIAAAMAADVDDILDLYVGVASLGGPGCRSAVELMDRAHATALQRT